MNNILKRGFNIKYESEHMYLSSKNIEIELQDHIKTDGADLYALKAIHVMDQVCKVTEKNIIDVHIFHDKLGHPGIKNTIATAK